MQKNENNFANSSSSVSFVKARNTAEEAMGGRLWLVAVPKGGSATI